MSLCYYGSEVVPLSDNQFRQKCNFMPEAKKINGYFFHPYAFPNTKFSRHFVQTV